MRARIEELKEIEIANYEKTRKKKDPDLDRASLKPRLPDDLVWRMVKLKAASPSCMNKGFILDGYPRTVEDAKHVFFEADPAANGEEGQDDAVASDSLVPGSIIDKKIVP